MHTPNSIHTILHTALHDSVEAAAPGSSKINTVPFWSRSQMDGVWLQSSAPFALSKISKCAPITVAQNMSAYINTHHGLYIDAQATGNGYVSLKPKSALLNLWFNELTATNNSANAFFAGGLFTPSASASPQKVLVDYSSPNCAKRQHAGHLRSAVIGDTLVRLFEACGWTVDRVNHLGDFGTPFGMILAALEQQGLSPAGLSLETIEQTYQQASAQKDQEEFMERARFITTQIQLGVDPWHTQWLALRASSIDQMQKVYDALGIGLKPEHIRAESSYQDQIPQVISDLLSKNLLMHSQGAVVFDAKLHQDPNQKTGKINPTQAPLLVQKSDGAYLYGATDLAAIFERSQRGYNQLWYVVDARQSEHFDALFLAAKKAGWLTHTQPVHIKFGMMLGPSGGPLKTRSGSVPVLMDILDEAASGAKKLVSTTLYPTPAEFDQAAVALGVSALKYWDLSKVRTTNIQFDTDLMLSEKGNSSLYIQYTYARMCAIMSRANTVLAAGAVPKNETLDTWSQGETTQQLLLTFWQQTQHVEASTKELAPHHLVEGLTDLMNTFSTWYEKTLVVAQPKIHKEAPASTEAQEAPQTTANQAPKEAKEQITTVDMHSIQLLTQLISYTEYVCDILGIALSNRLAPNAAPKPAPKIR